MKKKNVTPRAVAAPKHAAKPNPFELKGSKRKFDVLGKREKDGKKNVIKSREEAVNKRKKTLLVEYKQLRKANTFIDRRFGEDDQRLNEEDKALARFQAQRIREAKKATRFHLQDSSAAAAGSKRGDQQQQQDMLTHGGVSLEELDVLNARPTELLGDLDDDLLEDLVQQYHFGGGEEQQQEGEQGQAGRQRKTKKQVMEEIIAKSKAAKAEKARQKEADEAALDALDSSFKAISGGLAAFVKPAGFEKGRKLKADNDEDAAYDRAARELVFEAKGQASERTLTAEELQEKEQQRLAAFEAARLKRMRAAAAGEDEDDAADGDAHGDADDDVLAGNMPQGGYAAKRARMQREAEQWERRQRRKMQASGDDLDENFALSDEEDEGEDDSEDDGDLGSALDARRQAAAAGDHPLQKAFRQAAAKLAAKYGVEAAGAEEQEGESDEDDGKEGEEGSDEDGSEESDEGEAAAGTGSEGEADEGEEAAGTGSEGEADEGEEASDASEDAAAEQQGEDSSSSEEEQEAAAAAAPKQQQKQRQPEQLLDGPLDLSYTPPVPESYAEFAALVGGRPAQQLELAVQRIRVYNAAALATDSKRKLQVFYGVLVQHFAMLAGQQPTPAAHLDVLTSVLLQLTPEVPFYAATVARTRLEKMHDRLAAALADPLGASSAQQLMGWPGPRQLLQLRLFALLFPASDRRHPVMTPLALLLGKHLSQCPVVSSYTAAVGLLCCGMALANAADAQRFCPEVVAFLAGALRAFVSAARQQQAADSNQQQQGAAAADASAGVSLFTPGLLALSCCSLAAAGSKGKRQAKQARKQQQQQQQNGRDEQQQQLPGLKLYQLLNSAPDAAELSSDEFKLALLGCTVATATRACQLSSGCGVAAPEVLQPMLSAVGAVLSSVQGLPAAAEAALQWLQQQLQQASSDVVATRLPMVQSHRVKLVAPREFNPRYEEDYAAGKDYDPDRQRSEQRKLQRQLVKEKRGAMRELRCDAVFMSAERDAEKARVDAERLASQRAFYSELQVQEADAKSGGQRGLNPHRKKKK